MLEQLKHEANLAYTENGAITHESTLSHCLDLFATIGAIRSADEEEILARFLRAYAEDATAAMKILFYGRDIRGGLGERRVFRVILRWLADHEPEALHKNIAWIPEYGRYDDLLVLMGTACEADALRLIRTQLEKDLHAEDSVSLLAKWLPSVNASNVETIRMAKRIARQLGMTDAVYRKTLVALRKRIHLLENNLREKDYSFDYSKQPSKAMFKYRNAFWRNDPARYETFLNRVREGTATMHTDTLLPYDIIAPCLTGRTLSERERASMDVTWNALKNYCANEDALVVLDGSGSMYCGNQPLPAAVALSLAIYFAERNTGAFRNHFITFSRNPQLVEIKGRDLAEKVRYCATFNEVANTDLQAVFSLLLTTAVEHGLKQDDLPKRLYIISDMEFDYCAENASLTNFERAKQAFAAHGYELPEIIFWNVASRNHNQPVTKNEQGVALVSGCTPRLFELVAGGIASPYALMLDVIGSERYAAIGA